MEIIDIHNPSLYKRAIQILKQDGVIVYPTDTLYGLGANALSPSAVSRIFSIKKRLETKPLPIIVRNLAWAEALAYIYVRERKILEKIWPGTVTAILPKRSGFPDVVTSGKPNVALRVPESEFIDKLLASYGYPIIGTSANISGEEPYLDAESIKNRFEKELFKPDLIIDAGKLNSSVPSTILDLTGPNPKILRIGVTKPKILMKILGI